MSAVAATVDLGDPSSWCDSCCKRCPLLERCEVGQNIARRRSAHQIRGEDPDNPKVVIEDVCRDLVKALQMLAEIAERDGVDISGPTFDPSTSPDFEEASRLGVELAVTGQALADAALEGGARTDDPALAVLVGGSALVAAKTTRLVWERIEPPHLVGESWSVPSAAILLLIEHTAERLDRATAHLGHFVAPEVRARFRAIKTRHEQLWQPWVADVSAEIRAAVGALVTAGLAPSPFCRTDRTVRPSPGSAA